MAQTEPVDDVSLVMVVIPFPVVLKISVMASSSA